LHFVLVAAHASGAAVALNELDGFRCRASVGEAPAAGVAIPLANTLSGECVRTGKIIRCDDTQETHPTLSSTRSILLVPIRSDGSITGLVALFAREPRSFSDADVAVARCIAGTIAVTYMFAGAKLDAKR
jgi:putative methionine-R-sulfoxide reductase with GAF domain